MEKDGDALIVSAHATTQFASSNTYFKILLYLFYVIVMYLEVEMHVQILLIQIFIVKSVVTTEK